MRVSRRQFTISTGALVVGIMSLRPLPTSVWVSFDSREDNNRFFDYMKSNQAEMARLRHIYSSHPSCVGGKGDRSSHTYALETIAQQLGLPKPRIEFI